MTRETITLTQAEQQRVIVLTAVRERADARLRGLTRYELRALKCGQPAVKANAEGRRGPSS